MSLAELKELLDKVGVTDEFMFNWHKEHTTETLAYALLKYESKKHFIISFSSPNTSFLWSNTIEGTYYWKRVYYQLHAIQFPNANLAVKRSLLKIKKEGHKPYLDHRLFLFTKNESQFIGGVICYIKGGLIDIFYDGEYSPDVVDNITDYLLKQCVFI